MASVGVKSLHLHGRGFMNLYLATVRPIEVGMPVEEYFCRFHILGLQDRVTDDFLNAR